MREFGKKILLLRLEIYLTLLKHKYELRTAGNSPIQE